MKCNTKERDKAESEFKPHILVSEMNLPILVFVPLAPVGLPNQRHLFCGRVTRVGHVTHADHVTGHVTKQKLGIRYWISPLGSRP